MKSNGTESDNFSPEAERELRRLEGLQHYHKRRNTIMALVDARLAGRSEETVWQRGDTCSRNTWHQKWKHDRLFVDVLANVERLTREWTDGDELRALREASRRLALASPDAADQLVRMAATGRLRRVLANENGVEREEYEDAGAGDVRLAATAVLDRAGKETASKSNVSVDMVTADDLAEAREQARRYREERMGSDANPLPSPLPKGEGVEE